MPEILGSKQGGKLSVMDALGLSLAKSFGVDLIITPVIDKFTNGSVLLNAAVKIGGAGLVGQFAKGKIGSLAATAMVVSATDEVIGSLFGSKTSAQSGSDIAGADSFGTSNVVLASPKFI